MPTQTLARRTSQYTLTVGAPDHADADLYAALDALVQAAGGGVTGSWYARGEQPTLSVSVRLPDDETARAWVETTLQAHGSAVAVEVFTGYGIHRRAL